MIQANEVRIGNAVLDPIGLPKEVSIQVLYNIRDGLKYTGIPLSPEILEKCGFEISEDSYGGYLSSKFDLGAIRIKNNTWYNGCWTVKVDYLHQLQNLWKSLTGEELQFKP